MRSKGENSNTRPLLIELHIECAGNQFSKLLTSNVSGRPQNRKELGLIVLNAFRQKMINCCFDEAKWLAQTAQRESLTCHMAAFRDS